MKRGRGRRKGWWFRQRRNRSRRWRRRPRRRNSEMTSFSWKTILVILLSVQLFEFRGNQPQTSNGKRIQTHTLLIRTSLLLLSSTFRSMASLLRSSHCLRTSNNSAFAASSAAKSFSSTVNSTTGEFVRPLLFPAAALVVLFRCCCAFSGGLFDLDLSARDVAQGICVQISSCEPWHLAWNSYNKRLAILLNFRN